MKTDGGGGGREWWGWREGVVPSLSSSRFVSLLSCHCPVLSSGCHCGAWCQRAGLGQAGDRGCSPFIVWVPRHCRQCGTCFPGVCWPFLCVCMSICVRFWVVVVVKAVVFIVGGVVAVVALWSEVACQWGSLGVVRLEGTAIGYSQE